MKNLAKKFVDLSNRKLLAPYGADLVKAAAEVAEGNRECIDHAVKVGKVIPTITNR